MDYPTNDYLRRVPWLRSASDESLARIRSQLRLHTYADGEIIVRRGGRGGFVGIIESGEAVLISYTPGGRAFNVPLKAGECFTLTNTKRSSVTIRAVTPVTLWILKQVDVRHLMAGAGTRPSAKTGTAASRARPAAFRRRLEELVLVSLIVAVVSVAAQSPAGRVLRADMRYARGLRELEQQQWAAAEHHFQTALKFDPTHAASYNGLGYIYDRQGKGEAALAAFEQAAALNADSDVIQNNLGVVREHFGMTAAALANLQRAAELGINAPAIYVNLGNLYLSLEDWVNAGRAYREALRLSPRLAIVHYNLGFVYYRQRQFANAYGEFKRALELDPQLAVAYVGLGVLDFEDGDLAAAQAAFSRATELDSHNAVAYFYLGLTQKVLGDVGQSAAAFQRVLDLVTIPTLMREQATRHLQEFRR